MQDLYDFDDDSRERILENVLDGIIAGKQGYSDYQYLRDKLYPAPPLRQVLKGYWQGVRSALSCPQAR